MIQLSFVGGGPFDGMSLAVQERVPDLIELQMPCLPHDANDPDQRAIIQANIFPDELDQAVFLPNAESYSIRYVLERDDEYNPLEFRYAGWAVRGLPPGREAR